MAFTTFVDGTLIKASEVNENFRLNKALVNTAQNAFQILQATTFTSQDFLASDYFNDSNGKNNFVDITSSTTIYAGSNPQFTATNSYSYIQAPGDLPAGYTIYDVTGWSNPTYIYDNSNANAATIVQTTNGTETDLIGYTFSSRTVNKIYFNLRYQGNGSGAGYNQTITLDTYDGGSWTTVATLLNVTSSVDWYCSGVYNVNSTIAGYRLLFSSNDGLTSGATRTAFVYSLYDFPESASELYTLNIIPLDGTETACAVYARASIPTNSSMTVNISDGTNTIADCAVNTPIDITSLSSGNLKLIFNLKSSDNRGLITFEGFGVALTK